MKSVYKITSEWDIGEDLQVFSTKEKALLWLEDTLPFFGFEESAETLIAEGLLYIEKIEVI